MLEKAMLTLKRRAFRFSGLLLLLLGLTACNNLKPSGEAQAARTGCTRN